MFINNSYTLSRAWAMFNLALPTFPEMSPKQLWIARQENRDTFERIKTNLGISIVEIEKEILRGTDIQAVCDYVQKELLDPDIMAIREKARALTKYTAFRAAGYTVGTSAVLYGTFLPGDYKYIGAAMGGAGAIKLYEELVRMMEAKNGLMRDMDRVFLAKLH